MSRKALIGKDWDDMGSTRELLLEPFEHVGTLQVLMMLSRQPVKGKGLLDIVFYPRAELGVFFLPAQQPDYQILRASSALRRS